MDGESIQKFTQALQHLLPSGYAWPRDSSSVLMRMVVGQAASLAELDSLTNMAVREWRPDVTSTRLSEWEEAVGLPDGCGLDDPTIDERRSAVMLRLRSIRGAYEDSSPAAPGAIAAICAAHGFAATVRYNIPFRVGRDRVGARLGQLDGKLYILLDGVSEPFRVGVDRVGTRLYKRPRSAYALGCYLQKQLPARFAIHAIFNEV